MLSAKSLPHRGLKAEITRGSETRAVMWYRLKKIGRHYYLYVGISENGKKTEKSLGNLKKLLHSIANAGKIILKVAGDKKLQRLVRRAGFEPAITGLGGQRPSPG